MKLSVMKWLLSLALIVTVGPVVGQEPSVQELRKFNPVVKQPEPSTPPATPPQAGELLSDGESAANGQFEVLMSGPIHEAFAEPNAQTDAKALIVTKAPPEAIDEVPPDVQPDGENIEWIPGYWGWDESADDFVWVTGLWRQTPPGHQWVPGYWNQTEDGYQWISGFWADLNAEEIAYLPAPPAAPEAGPSTPEPGADYFWVPGQWNYDNTQYQWQAGYWAQHNPDWIWINTAYLPTPQGYVCRPGYWDYQLGYRGTIFYPVRFNSGYTGNYRPNYVMNVGVNWLANLFVNPGYRHYYFGNYYGARYQKNFYPWATYYQGQRNFDPLYSYYRAGQHNHMSQINQVHQQYVQNQQFRPAQTLKAQQKQDNEIGQSNPSLAFNAATIGALALAGNQLRRAHNQTSMIDSHAAFQFKKLDKQAADKVTDSLKPVRELQQQRRNFEKSKPASNASLAGEQKNKADKDKPNDNRAKSEPKKADTASTQVQDDKQLPKGGSKSASVNTNPAVKLKLPGNSTGRGRRAEVNPNGAAQTGQANEAGKGRSNVEARGSKGPRVAEPRNPGPSNPAVRNVPPRVSVPNLPPVPHGPAGTVKGGAQSQKGEAKANGSPKPSGKESSGKANGPRGDKK